MLKQDFLNSGMWNSLLLDKITVLGRRFNLYSGVWDSGKRCLTKLGLEVTESVSCYDDLCKERSWPGGIAGLLYIILFIAKIGLFFLQVCYCTT